MSSIKFAVNTEVSALALALLAGADQYQNLSLQAAVLPKHYYWETMAADISAWLNRSLA